MPGQDLTYCYICGETKGTLMLCNHCCDSFHPHCGNYSRHITRGGFCLKKICQSAKLSRSSKAAQLKKMKWIEQPQEPEALEALSVDSDSSSSSKLTSDVIESIEMQPTAVLSKSREGSRYILPKQSRKRTRVSDVPIFDCCHLCQRRVRSFTLVMCFSCDRVFCSFCVAPTDLITGRCRVCKGLCGCKSCFEETFSRDFEAIMNKKPKWTEDN